MRFTLAALAALTIPAAAADMPLKAQPAPAPYSWAGWYAGANLGYGWGDPSATIVPGSIPPPFPGTLNSASPPFVMSTHPQGGLIGAQAGYNWQFDRTVVGLEIDFQYADVHDMVQRGFSNTFIFVGDPSTTAGVATLESHMNWLATLRGRFGYSFDRFLPYVTGGAALANLRSTITISGYHKDDGAPGPFAFANPERVRGILQRAGFREIDIIAHDEQVGSGDLDAMLAVCLRVGALGKILRENPELRARPRALDREELLHRDDLVRRREPLRDGELLSDCTPAQLRVDGRSVDLEEAFLNVVRAREEVAA